MLASLAAYVSGQKEQQMKRGAELAHAGGSHEQLAEDSPSRDRLVQEPVLGLEDPGDPVFADDVAVSNGSVAGLLPSKGQPFVDPTLYGGSNLDSSNGLGEPLNVIVSALSSPAVLTRKGLRNYFRSLDFDFECLGLHSGTPQKAFLDPRGWLDQAFLFREVYTPLDHVFGTCIESVVGGNHIRAWQQAGTGAWFLALSKEQNITKHHLVTSNGYDVGRDEFVQKSQARKDARTRFHGKQYVTTVSYLTGYLPVGSAGVNHGIALDGRTALVTVKLLNDEPKVSAKARREKGKPAERPPVESPTSQQTPRAHNSNGRRRPKLSLGFLRLPKRDGL
ncbi:unnamed protein product [Parajaminaea phylloscopi]